MLFRIAACALLSAITCVQSPTTQPQSEPTTLPTTKPSHFPTPAELVDAMKRLAAEKQRVGRVAYIDLKGEIPEEPSELSLLLETRGTTLRTVVERLHAARDDKNLRAVLLTVGEVSLNLAQAQEIREAVAEFRRVGKRCFVYADSYDTVSYTLACGATDVCLMSGGEIVVPGVGLETMFYKGTLDKIGVQADYVQIGEYKGAEEPFTRTAPSDELRAELTRLTEALFEQIVDGISLGRNVSRQTARNVIDDTMITALSAKQRGLVDHIVEQDGLRELIRSELGDDVDLVHNYGKPAREEVDFSNPFALLSLLSKRPEVSEKPSVAIVYAVGTIVDGEGGESYFGEGEVGSDWMRKTMRIAERDENVKAIVIRIDSPGGSALASEAMWQAVRRVAKRKPVVVSVGSMAASGGYYLACAGDWIIADPCGIVGSIGVVGGKFVVKDLYDKLGLSTETFAQGRNAGLFSATAPFSDRQRRMIRNWMQETYEQFTKRVLATRGDKIADIDKVARGRVFTAKQGRELGMVDELGGTERAIAVAASRAGLTTGTYDVRILPPPRTLADVLFGTDSDDAVSPLRRGATVGPAALWSALPDGARQMLARQTQLMRILHRRPVAVFSPFVVRFR
ncbi:MAG: signal peptide peptidase SppA [Tepidisphaeraceae bacterium]